MISIGLYTKLQEHLGQNIIEIEHILIRQFDELKVILFVDIFFYTLSLGIFCIIF
ncbi:MAG TPA: hypothetical protein PLH07_09000 [Sulfurovum sp.]|nr:hypothetical protein [Sulfurovum sp.]HQS78395.1 hypothetical protein [Sulfurovum sp.]HQT29420.1 hypothetical protein [Sulfurovum sp.]